jgi:hypothetical protein
MPDRELPENLRAQLSSELEQGAPLTSPLPMQARYTRLAGASPVRAQVRGRLVAAAIAACALIAVAAFAGPPQARAWIGQSMGNIVRGVENSTGTAPASPSPGRTPDDSHQGEGRPAPAETPEANESPEPSESQEPAQTPESGESPEPTQSPDGDDHGGSPSPSPSPQPTDGDGGGGGDGGGSSSSSDSSGGDSH